MLGLVRAGTTSRQPCPDTDRYGGCTWTRPSGPRSGPRAVCWGCCRHRPGNLSPAQELNQIDEMAKSAVAAAVYQEYRIAREVPGHSFRAPGVRIDDPVYAAAIDVLTPAPGAPLSPAFVRRLRGMLDTGPLPAVAELLVFAGETRPENRHELRELAAEFLVRAGDGSAIGLDALAALAASPVLGDLVDPVGLLREAERCEFAWPGETWIPRDATARLFPALLERAPAAALRKFYEVTSTNWSFAMALLPRGPGPARDDAGHRPVRSAHLELVRTDHDRRTDAPRLPARGRCPEQ